jgi:hypothetical protein
MSPLLGPIFAQLVTLSVADRTEARYIVSDEKYAEAATSPRVGLNFGWKHTSLLVGYAPSITVTPLDSSSQLLVFHTGAVSVSHVWARTTVMLSQSLGYGEINFEDQALAGQAPAPNTGMNSNAAAPGTTTGNQPPPASMPGAISGTTTTPGSAGGMTPLAANQIRSLNRTITFITSATTLSLTNRYSEVLTLYGDAGYVESGSVGARSDPLNYPLVKGPRGQVSARYRISPHDDWNSTVSTAFATSSANDDRAWFLVATEGYAHAFDRNTKAGFGAGLSINRNSLADGTISYSIYPAFNANLSNLSKLARGTLRLEISAAAAPYLDPVRVVVDPQLGFGGGIGWAKDDFTSSLAGGTALSLGNANANATGALNSAAGSFTLGYRLSQVWSLSTGVRAAWQTYGGATTIPLSYSAFFGINFALLAPLNG